MKRLIATFLLLILCAFSLQAQTSYTVDQVPNVQLRDRTRFVSDPAGILSGETVQTIDSLLHALRTRGLAEVAVVILPSIAADDDPYFFAHNLLNRWGVGEKGKDNGLVILIAQQEREIQFETGYGLEGVLPDALCKRIQTQYMVPALAKGEWDKGTEAGVRAVYEILTEGTGALAIRSDTTTGNNDFFLTSVIFTLIIPIGILLLFTVMASFRKRCPVCKKKRALRLVRSERIASTSTSNTTRYIYRCKHCGHQVERIVTHHRNNGSGLGGGRGIFMGGPRGFGGGFGGGSFGGGFGGGMSGGGGARSRF